MATTNLTVRVDKQVRKDFDQFCEKVGLTPTVAVNMFIRTAVRTRTIPFIVTDTNETSHIVTKLDTQFAGNIEQII
ncbi:MAG: type II toxin-antitoxin system RelB/DinJ family antitoxin [Defluviitaleaceae bacterium]|nr:type II toxin-antitoxin system RelB/DinJ family antitoxin [Defluviitaleaceae bacterium]